ncbi:MAG: hypothetical protein ABIG61_07165 [Planctomycetota bacterium]
MKKPIPLEAIYREIPLGIKEGDVLKNGNQYIMIMHDNSTDQTLIGYVYLTGGNAGHYFGRYKYHMDKNKCYTLESIKKLLGDALDSWDYIGNINDIMESAMLPI